MNTAGIQSIMTDCKLGRLSNALSLTISYLYLLLYLLQANQSILIVFVRVVALGYQWCHNSHKHVKCAFV